MQTLHQASGKTKEIRSHTCVNRYLPHCGTTTTSECLSVDSMQVAAKARRLSSLRKLAERFRRRMRFASDRSMKNAARREEKRLRVTQVAPSHLQEEAEKERRGISIDETFWPVRVLITLQLYLRTASLSVAFRMYKSP